MKIIKLVFFLILITCLSKIFAQTSFNISNKTTGDTLFTIDENGKVGIGTTAPVAKLEVLSLDPDQNGSIRVGTSDLSNYLRLYSGRSTFPDPFIMWNEGSALRFGTSFADEYMRLTSEGNLGIGTTTPGYPLTIAPGLSERGLYIDHDQTGTASTRGIFVDLDRTGTGNGDATGVYSETTNNNGVYSTYGVWGNADGSAGGWKVGVYGVAGGTGSVFGLRGWTNPSDGTAYGVQGVANGSGSSSQYGVYGNAQGAGTGTHYGVYGTASGGGTHWAGYFNGNVYAGGNLGIGTSNPTEMLEVADTIYSSIGGFKFPDNTVQTTAAVSAVGGYTLDQAYDQGGPGAGGTIIADNGAVNILGTDGLTVNGNVGIGTTSTSNPFTIVSGAGDTTLYIDNDLSSPTSSSFGLIIDVDKDITGDTHLLGARISTTNNSGNGISYGVHSIVDGTSGYGKYGVYSEVAGDGDLIALFGHANGSGSGTQYGLIASADDWAGYFGSGNVHIQNRLGIGTESPTAALHVESTNGEGVLFSGGYGSGLIPIEGEGTRMMWYPGEAAFRAGTAYADRWDDVNIGSHSFATGYGTQASGNFSTAIGHVALAEGDYSTAWGHNILVSGDYSFGIKLSDISVSEFSQANTMAIIGGKVGIGETAPAADLHVDGRDGVLFTSDFSIGTIPAEGSGRRMMWYPTKAAFRVGDAGPNNWDDVNIGLGSFATGGNTIASGTLSAAFGYGAIASGDYTFAIGRDTEAGGRYSTAMGTYVNTSGEGSFTIGDNSTTTTSTFSIVNQFNARFANGYNLYTNDVCTLGVSLGAGGTSWSTISDSTKKENFKSVNGEEFLDKISRFRLTSWNYKGQDPNKFRHYGPMAQDFYAAFGNDGIGTIGNDTTIASADFDGVNFIAIQALEKRTTQLKAKTEEIEKLKNEISSLKSKIEKFEALFSKVEELTNKNKKQLTHNK